MAKLKVYHGLIHVAGNRSVNVMIAATSKKKIADIVDCSVSYVNNYWSVGGNKEAIKVATATPETIIAEFPAYSNNFMSFEEGKKLVLEKYEKDNEEYRKRISEKKKDNF